jgi:hypothetical protein
MCETVVLVILYASYSKGLLYRVFHELGLLTTVPVTFIAQVNQLPVKFQPLVVAGIIGAHFRGFVVISLETPGVNKQCMPLSFYTLIKE